MESLPTNAPKASSSPYVKEVNVQNFMQEVIQTSLQVPVLAYFTAAWCGPCKQYGPLLEKVVNAAKGKVRLARIDVDKSPQLAQQFRIQSVPMVFIFLQGQPLDGFQGALPESQLKQLIDQVAGAGPADDMVKATLESASELLAQGETEAAKQAYLAILAEEKDNIEAIAGIARCLTLEGSFEQAEQILSEVPQEKQNNELILAAKAGLTLAKNAPKAVDTKALEAALAADPLNHQARFDLAVALFAGGKQEEAVNELLAILAKSRDWNEGAAKAQLLTFFEALGFANPISVQGRRKMSSILFA